MAGVLGRGSTSKVKQSWWLLPCRRCDDGDRTSIRSALCSGLGSARVWPFVIHPDWNWAICSGNPDWDNRARTSRPAQQDWAKALWARLPPAAFPWLSATAAIG
jgi:hypothetical protein